MNDNHDILQRSEIVVRKLLEELKHGKYANMTRLPSEIVLAEEIGVSRTLLRDCLALLEREGFVSRKHGIGTIINRHVLLAVTRMDMEEEFLQMIKNAGYESRIAYTKIKRIKSDREMAEKLEIQVGDPVYFSAKMITADGKCTIYCEDHIAASLIKDSNYDEERLRAPIFFFLKEYCDTEVETDLTEVRPVAADGWLAEILQVKEGTPLLHMSEVGYDFYGNPVLFSKEYYVDGVLHHTVLRKKI